MAELLVGCGPARDKRVLPWGRTGWTDLTTLDINPKFDPDVVWNLNERPLPFDDATFDEVHAYEVLEHLSSQGDYRSFFAQFTEFWRILKPEGVLCATVPWWEEEIAWSDPGHARIITPGALIFLSQASYEQEGTMMTDYRDIYFADFKALYVDKSDRGGSHHFTFILQANKQ